MHNIIIINAAMGNIGSVVKRMSRIGCTPIVSTDPADLKKADKILLPGVGHFGSVVQKLKNTGFWEALNNAVLIQKKPVLGICLGMQLMAKFSEEGDETGLGWVNASVVRFNVRNPFQTKIPHMGWNTINLKKKSNLFDGIALHSDYYFVHSFHIQCDDPGDILATTDYEYPFTSAIQRDHIFGVQFHPEKSHDAGEQVLKNFINL